MKNCLCIELIGQIGNWLFILLIFVNYARNSIQTYQFTGHQNQPLQRLQFRFLFIILIHLVQSKIQQHMGAQPSFQNSLFMNIVTGDTQSQQLFDFTSHNITNNKNILKFPSFLNLEKDQLNFSSQKSSVNLFQLSMPNFKQIKVLASQKAQNLWKVIEQDNHHIRKGDQIKVGKVKLRIKDIVTSEKQKTLSDRIHLGDDLHHSRTLRSVSSSISMVSKDEQCRVCFDSHSNENDPLLSLCKCSGSVKFIHFKCLKDWIASSITKKEYPNYVQYSYIKSHCQLCKEIIKNEFTFEGKDYSLYNLDRLTGPHIVFQTLQNETTPNKAEMYVIRLQQDMEVVIGRNNAAQVMMKDISISRVHCSITMKDKRVFIKDKKSKFGTLIKIKNQINFDIEKGLQLQYQSKLIKINQERPLSSCCCDTGSTYSLFYQSDKQIKTNQQFKVAV